MGAGEDLQGTEGVQNYEDLWEGEMILRHAEFEVGSLQARKTRINFNKR